MSVESGAFGALLAKYGWLKLFTLGAALAGAAMMAAFRPPKSRRELALHAVIALGCSFLFGDTVVKWADSFFEFIDLNTAAYWDFLQFYITVHGLVGAFSWGLMGGIATLRDRFSNDPTGTVKDVKSL